MRILLLIAISVICVSGQCYTKKCKALWNSYGNAGNQFYYRGSYGGDIHPNPLQYSTNRQFRTIIQNNIKYCSGKYCVNGQFSCQSNGNTNCYHVEHIIDENGPEYTNCPRCKDIPGNMIMAAGDWNMALGGLARTRYSQMQTEKSMIYGSSVMQRARAYIQTCCSQLTSSNSSVEIDCENNDGECNCDSGAYCGCDCSADIILNGPINDINNAATLDVVTTILVVIIAFGVLILCCYIRHKRLEDMEKINSKADSVIADPESLKI